MAQLVGLIVSEDDGFKKHFARLLRTGAIPVSVMDDRASRDGAPPDLVIVDTRDASSAMASIERLRASADIGNVVLLRGSRELKERVDVWGPERASDRVARAVKQSLDPVGILNAGRGPI